MHNRPEEVAVRSAATLVLARDSRRGLEVFMLRRSTRATFVGGAHVFPGGAVEARDTHPELIELCRGLDDERASTRLGMASGGLAYWVAAIRECFEEAGVLMACDQRGVLLDAATQDRAERLARYRQSVMAGELGLDALCRQESLVLATHGMHYFSHWITPQGPPRRYDTRFFIAAAPEGQEGSACQRETIDQCWIRPAEALDAWRRRDIQLVFPTVKTLEALADYHNRDSLLRAMAAGEEAVKVTQPRIRK